MGRLIAVLALAGAAAMAAHPSPNSRARATASAAVTAKPAVSVSTVPPSMEAAERDFARRQAEVALSGSAPLFGAEGLPKPRK
jgi:hypothetical protein